MCVSVCVCVCVCVCVLLELLFGCCPGYVLVEWKTERVFGEGARCQAWILCAINQISLQVSQITLLAVTTHAGKMADRPDVHVELSRQLR